MVRYSPSFNVPSNFSLLLEITLNIHIGHIVKVFSRNSDLTTNKLAITSASHEKKNLKINIGLDF